jgi:2-keto-4-pentenoate hydratase/2-oxohepta-3-ene-1,7-dioic acid hydratase in catechol pathway
VEILRDESKVEFIVVQDNFLTPTAKFADIVLPACTQFETWGVEDGWKYGDEVILQPKLVEPPGECKSDYRICAELAERLGIGEAFTEGRGPNDETIAYAPHEVRLLAPLPNPASVRDFYAFEAHVKKGFEKRGEAMPAEWYELPVYYKSGHHNMLGTDEDVAWPSFTEKFDYELEMAAVIGRRGRNISAACAREYIAGFTVMNDFSARDIQRREMKVRLGPAKGKDWATALGPWLVTPDEIGDPYNLRMTARVNGETWSEGNSGSIYWKFEQMIEFLSRDDTIYPGDVIGSGTVGTGCGLELDRWVKRGDVMELEIEKIGVLRNRVV